MGRAREEVGRGPFRRAVRSAQARIAVTFSDDAKAIERHASKPICFNSVRRGIPL